MIISQVSKNYAKALVSLEIDEKGLLKDFRNILETFRSSDDLRNILSNPTINLDQKLKITEDIFKSKISDDSYRFLILLIEKNRLNLLDEIYESTISELDRQNNIQTISVTSAVELNDEFKLKILKLFEKKLNKTIKPEWIIDREIIAGLSIKIGDTLIDTSLKNKIKNLSKIIK